MTDENLRNLVSEAYRLSEQKLQSQFASALAADQRALNFCAILIAAAAILTGFFDPRDPKYGLLLSASLLIVAAAMAGYAARPVKFYSPGAKFSDLTENLLENTNYCDVLSEVGKFNDDHSLENSKVMKSNNNILKWAFSIAILGIAVAVLTSLI